MIDKPPTVEEILSILKSREVTVLRMRYGLGMERHTISEIGKQASFTRQLIQQTEREAWRTLWNQGNASGLIELIRAQGQLTAKEDRAFEHFIRMERLHAQKHKALTGPRRIKWVRSSSANLSWMFAVAHLLLWTLVPLCLQKPDARNATRLCQKLIQGRDAKTPRALTTNKRTSATCHHRMGTFAAVLALESEAIVKDQR